MRNNPPFKLWLTMLLLLLFVAPVSAGVNVFVYHRFDDVRYPSTNISGDIFSQQLEWLRTENYQVLTLGAVVDRLRSGQSLPKRCAVLTIDDAFSSFYTAGLPLLKQFGFPATLFVNIDGIGGASYMSWAQLAEVAATGIEIGNHSATHDYLVEKRSGEDEAQRLTRIRADLSRAQQTLRKNLGIEPKVFSYPYGEYDLQLQQLVAELGFSAAVAQQSGVVNAATDRYALPRFPMGGQYATLRGFRDKLAMEALQVEVSSPVNPLAPENPPTLRLKITDPEVDLGRLNCYIDGSPRCAMTWEGDVGADTWLTISAATPLSGRRGKFTLTAPNRRTGRWHWFSQLWIFPVVAEGDR
ncbi:MAG: polysaccharide deacetylase family protein [Desulfuromonadaceae bacterium]|nr:polysaccharide deacetylase family protein [Desulfuromonadaceae bacterium]